MIWPVLLVITHIPIAVSGATTPAPTRGFEVDTSNRTEVVSFYQAIYMASEGYQDRMGWTGNYTSTAAGAEGTVPRPASEFSPASGAAGTLPARPSG